MSSEVFYEAPLISFVSVATGRYLEFWHSQIKSARIFLNKEDILEFVVFTDRTQDIQFDLFDSTNWKLVVIPIEQSKWPYPSLLKFQYIQEHSSFIQGHFIWHVDADMLFASGSLVEELIEKLRIGKIATVAHPGYFRPSGVKLMTLYFKEPMLFIGDSIKFFREWGLGTWEKNPSSLSFVPKSKRHSYVCGGSWGGEKELLIRMCKEISGRINLDEQNNVMARFHDESHLNWYVANNDCLVLSPSYCFEESYSQLQNLDVRIIAVNKNVKSEWIR